MIVPHWLLVVVFVFAGLPARHIARRLWVFEQAAPDLPCPTCGYDLRATPTRCPECGTEPTTSVAAKAG